jgi:UDP-glucose 4-epimerase
MKYLVTGGAGFIGSHLCESLIQNGDTVTVIDDLSSGFISNLIKHKNLHLIAKQLQSIKEDEVAEINGIFHLAAQASVPVSINDFYTSSTNNLQSSFKVFDIARKLQIPVVYASSSAIYGNLPLGDEHKLKYDILSPYALDKLCLEQYAQLAFDLYKVGSVGLRFFNVYGPRQDPKSPYSGVISIFIERFINKESIRVNGGHQTRDFVYVKDIANTIIQSMSALHSEQSCFTLNVGTGNAISVDDLYDRLAEIFNYKPPKEYFPLDKTDPERSGGNFEKLSRQLGINNKTFTQIDKGLLETVNYYTNND